MNIKKISLAMLCIGLLSSQMGYSMRRVVDPGKYESYTLTELLEKKAVLEESLNPEKFSKTYGLELANAQEFVEDIQKNIQQINAAIILKQGKQENISELLDNVMDKIKTLDEVDEKIFNIKDETLRKASKTITDYLSDDTPLSEKNFNDLAKKYLQAAEISDKAAKEIEKIELDKQNLKKLVESTIVNSNIKKPAKNLLLLIMEKKLEKIVRNRKNLAYIYSVIDTIKEADPKEIFLPKLALTGSVGFNKANSYDDLKNKIKALQGNPLGNMTLFAFQNKLTNLFKDKKILKELIEQ